jgi:probable phosphoglycerate mutase
MPLPRSIILVRHGQSEHHVRGLTGGWTDTPLTDLGREQARRVASRLKSELAGMPVRLYSSDLKRAAQTAGTISEALNLAVQYDERLREHNNGECANLTWEEASRRYPDVLGRPLPLDEPAYPGAETARALFERAGGFLHSLYAGVGTPILVSHGGTIVCLIGQWLGMTAEVLQTMGFEAYPTSVTVLRDRGTGRGVERANDVTHLSGMEGWASIGEAASLKWT